MKAVNWNTQNDMTFMYWKQNIAQFWVDTEFKVSKDIVFWNALSEDEKDVYKKVLAGLTGLDTHQGTDGMPLIAMHTEDLRKSSVYTFMGMMECFTNEHELLTPTGWKNISEITKDDTIVQYDKDKQVLSWTNPINVSSHWENVTYRLKSSNGHINQHVSGNHRFLIGKRKKDNSTGDVMFEEKVIKAMDLYEKNLYSTDFVYNTASMEKGIAKLCNYDKFMIALQADGSMSKTRNMKGEYSHTGIISGKIECKFNLKKKRKTQRLLDIIQGLGWEYRQYENSYYKSISVYVPYDEELFIDRTQKKLWEVFDVSLINGDYAREIIEEMSLWDGTINQKTGTITYSCKEKINVDFYSMIATIAGYKVTEWCSRKIVGDKSFPLYNLRIMKSKNYSTLHNTKIIKESGNIVYGVEVSTGYLLTRNGKSINISGNCIHAKSYSTIFTSLLPSKETDYLLDEWVPNNEFLTYKANVIVSYYHKLFKPVVSDYDKYMARVASVFLESCLFYSGFFYPLYLAGQGVMTTSGEIIRKILLDETIHGSFVGFDAQDLFKMLSDDEKVKAEQEVYILLDKLLKNEFSYTHYIYDKLGLSDEVIEYVKYNANRALANLGYPNLYENVVINPIIENAMDTSTKNHDFFSVKGDGYVVSMNVEPLQDEDFIFDD